MSHKERIINDTLTRAMKVNIRNFQKTDSVA